MPACSLCMKGIAAIGFESNLTVTPETFKNDKKGEGQDKSPISSQ